MAGKNGIRMSDRSRVDPLHLRLRMLIFASMINPRILGLMLIAAYVLLVATGPQNAMASIPEDDDPDDGDSETVVRNKAL